MRKSVMMFLLAVLLVIGAFGCDQATKLFGDSTLTPEMGLKILDKAETTYPVIVTAVGEYLQKNPEAMTPEDQVKLKAANQAFVVAYVTTKKAIQDIIVLKKGQTITMSDISGELIIFAGKYVEFKKAFKTLTGGKVAVAFPDEVGVGKTSDEILKDLGAGVQPATPDAVKPANVAPS